MKRRIILQIAFLVLSTSYLLADNMVFSRISTNQGLSHYTALSIYEDEFGTIWTATPMGLNRCKGSDVVVYANDIKDSSSLSCDRVVKVTGNQDGLVYILTKQSFEVLDLKTEKIVSRFLFNGSKNIHDIYYKDGLYAIYSGNEIVRWNEKDQVFDNVYNLSVKSVLRTIFIDRANNIWVSSNNTLYRLDAELNHQDVVIQDVYVHDVGQDKDGRIFVSTLSHGIYICSENGKVARNITVSDGIVSNFVRTVCQDPLGRYWVGTDKGLNIMSETFLVESTYVADGQDGSLSNSSIYDIICDAYGNMWTATYFGGLNLCNPSKENYRLIKSGAHGTGLSSSLVSCVIEDKRGDVWVGTVDGGLTRYSAKYHEFTWFKHRGNSNSINGDNIKTLYYDKDKDVLWIGTHLRGFNSLDLRTLKFKSYDIPGSFDHPSANVVSAIIPYDDGLVLTSYHGVFFFDPKTEQFERLLDISYVRSAFMDSYSGLWMGTTSGQLFHYDMLNGHLNSYGRTLRDQNNGLASIIYDITEDMDGNLWMASFGGGLKKYDFTTGTFTTLNTLNSDIPNNNVLAVKYCENGRLIATDHNGYMIYDLSSESFEVRNRSYGLPVDYVMENALFYSHDSGITYIGTNDGLVSFRESTTDRSEAAYPIIFSGLYVNGEEVKPGDDSGILDKSMMYVDELVLNYRQNSFEVEFFQSRYSHDKDRQLMYCLDSDHRKWQKLSPGETKLRFYNQPPGKFRILIKDPSVVDGQNVLESSLVIYVKPPFYRTTAAYIIYFILVIIVIVALIYSFINRMKIKERIRYDEKKMHYEKALMQSKQQAKLQFFFGISHEFSTPLTIIMGQLELLLMKYNFKDSIKGKLESVYKNAVQLHDLLLELLEFRKHEMGQMELKVEEYDICSIAQDSFQLYKEYSQSREIDFELTTSPEHIWVWCDRKQIYKVFNNLISNAFKYTEAEGKVSVSVHQLEEEICIQVTDNGCGMDSEDVSRIFTEFYQGKQSVDKPGVGIGLHLVKSIIELHKGRIEVKSKLNKGTSFFVYLKSGNGHFSQDQLSHNSIIDSQVVSEQLYEPDKLSEVQKSVHEFTMLIVEDNNSLREMIANIFSQSYKVIQAVDGRDGWNKLTQSDVDIVVSDIVMPNMSGTELCQKIKDNLETCHIPVVLLSVRADVQNCIDGFNAHADDYITKPFSIRLLLSRCESLLDNRKILQKKFQQSPNTDLEVLTSNALDKEFTEKLIRLVEENIDNSDLNIAFLQQQMYVSRTTLFQKLKAITGQTPMEFISSIRLKKAADLLLSRPDMSIAAVSDAVGFSSSKYFSRIFKETYHIRPIDYRNGKTSSSEG